MDRHKFSLNKKNNKTRPKTPLLSKRQASNKSNKSNINNNKPQRKSPKTIDYDKLMEKYGNFIDDNFDKLMRKKKNNTRTDNNTMINKSPDRYKYNNYFNKTEITNNPNINYEEEEKNNLSICGGSKKNNKKVYNKLIRNPKQNFKIPSIKSAKERDPILNNNINNNNYTLKNGNKHSYLNRCNSNNSNNKNKIKTNNNNEFEKLKKEIFLLKQENNKLRANTITHNTSSNAPSMDNYIYDKLLLLLNLCRKYAKKFNKLYPLCELEFTKYNININTEIFEELKNTIVQYNTMIFSEKISNLFKIKNNDTINNDYENILNPLDISKFEPTSIAINTVDKYKSCIKKLKEENKEFTNIKKKMEEVMKENMELKNKLEEFNLKETKYNYQNNVIENLKFQVETLNNSIKFKESKINSLQNIIEKNRTNQNLFDSNSISEKNININQDKNNSKNIIFNKKEINNDFQIMKGNKNINRYDNNNIISKITISSYNENLNSNNTNSNIFTNKNSLEEINSTNDIIKDNINNIENENVNIKTPSEKKIKKNENIYCEENNMNNCYMNQKEKNALNDEIEQLDQEIINLKSKLTQIIKK